MLWIAESSRQVDQGQSQAVCTYTVLNGMLLSIKKKKILPFATVWMYMESIMLSEISQSEKDK